MITHHQPAIEVQAARARPEVLRRHVDYLCNLKPPRSAAHPDAMERAAEYIQDQFRQTGVMPSDQHFTAEGRTFRNVRLRLGPADGPLLVIGAHYDVAGDQPGADDNASGVAGLLELARLLAPVRATLKRPVELVAYALEEPPHFATPTMGSAVHARELRLAKTPVDFMISLEMIGYFRDDRGSQHYPLDILKAIYPDRGNFIGLVGRLREGKVIYQIKPRFTKHCEVPLRTMAAPGFVPGVDLSDHRNYWEHGMYAVMITDTAFLRNPNYHQSSDRPETLDYPRMSQVVNGVFGIATEP